MEIDITGPKGPAFFARPSRLKPPVQDREGAAITESVANEVAPIPDERIAGAAPAPNRKPCD